MADRHGCPEGFNPLTAWEPLRPAIDRRFRLRVNSRWSEKAPDRRGATAKVSRARRSRVGTESAGVKADGAGSAAPSQPRLRVG